MNYKWFLKEGAWPQLLESWAINIAIRITEQKRFTNYLIKIPPIKSCAFSNF